MMKHEFEKLYGCEVPGKVYDKLECLYMQDDSVKTKEQFVAKIKRLHFVEKYMMEMIKDQQATLNKVEELAKRWKADSDETLDRANVQEARKEAVAILVEGSRLYYGNNNYLMSLQRTCDMSSIIEIIEGK